MTSAIDQISSRRSQSPGSRFYLGAFLLVLLFALPLQAEDGYRLWLRYEPVTNRVQREAYLTHITEIVVATNSPTQQVIRDEIKDGLSGLLGGNRQCSQAVTRSGALVIGTPANNPAVAAVGWDAELKQLGNDGYLIRSVTNSGRALTVIASQGETGALYGTFHFLRLLQTRQAIDHLAIAEKPALERRLLNHWDNLNGSVERGFAGRSLWQWAELPGKLEPRYQDYARADASLGLNGAVLNNVNARPEQLSTENLKKAAALAEVFRPYGIRVYLSVNFASPKKLGGLKTANPKDPAVRKWWRQKADEIYALIPDFGGFLVKANSEGQPGPQDYGLTHADGANLLADALAPHGGVVMWRAFVYNSPKVDPDRAKRAYTEFKPLDGKFGDNVFVQVKTGPIDFQPHEPFHPLFGAMHKTSLMAELEITQENMGHATDLVFLAPMWQEFLESDTHADGPGSTVAKTFAASAHTAIAGVANTGQDRNWCGHDFAQANWYAFGRLAWNSRLSAAQIAEEWGKMTWSNDPKVIATITNMMLGSWEGCVDYEMPLGLHHIMEGGGHYDPAPQTHNNKSPEYSGWYYHQADARGIGFDRTASGSDAVAQYAPPVGDYFSNLNTCPPDLLLWFHHVDWDYKLSDGRTVWDELCARYNAGVEYVKTMQVQWETLRGRVDAERFEAVQKKLATQLAHAVNWRDTCLRYFQSVNNKPLPDHLAMHKEPS
ncbi:MAG TPA: alpha-glucuronidase family glycosyl hydrolase [Verrucomicrobiae bacterium]|nr:alpha-glucuronidase family glycosyl hydrolase [Verrucomicrobiae bacterium]